MTMSRGGRPSFAAPAWDLGRLVLEAPHRPLVMGIVNLTPDSFYPASRQPDPGSAVEAALSLLDAGADVLDLGAESTRPGSAPVPADAEQQRLLPVLQALRQATDAPITVDTRRFETARMAVDHGADAINDVAGGRDPGLLALIADRGVGMVLMHMLGEPRTMQHEPSYQDAVAEVTSWLAGRAKAAEAAGIRRGRIMLDPGIGFGKLLDHNLELLEGLDTVSQGRPLLLGASRKRFIGEVTGAEVDQRLGGSLAAVAAAYRSGCTMVRVHDVAATAQFLDVLAAIDGAATR